MFGREEELSLLITRCPPEFSRLHAWERQDGCIQAMLECARDRCGAVEFGLGSILFKESPIPHLARRFRENQPPIDIYHGVMFPSGERAYREHVAPYLEMNTPLSTDIFDCVRRIRRNHQIATFLCQQVREKGWEVVCFNTVSDRKGKSCGMHDNFTVPRDLMDRIFLQGPVGIDAGTRKRPLREARLAHEEWLSWLVLRSIFIGAGKVGREFPDKLGNRGGGFQISERVDFLESLINPETSVMRPLINTRDEPHADPDQYGRLHVINGEGNRSPRALALGIGMSRLILDALKDYSFRLPWYFGDPLQCAKTLSRDPTLSCTLSVIRRRDGVVESKKPLDLLDDIVCELKAYSRWALVPPWTSTILGWAEEIVGWLQKGDPKGKTTHVLDWKIKQKFLTRYIERRLGLNSDDAASWEHPMIQQCDLQYHNLSNDALWQRMVADYDIADAKKFLEPFGRPDEPRFWSASAPPDTRSYAVSYLLRNPHLQKRVAFTDWDEIILYNETFQDARFIELDDPRKFTKRHFESVMGKRPDFSFPKMRQKLIDFFLKEEHRLPEDPPPVPDPVAPLTVIDVKRPQGSVQEKGIHLCTQGYPAAPPPCASDMRSGRVEPEPTG